MQLQYIRGGNRDELENRKYQIGIGISLGDKWFSVENIAELVRWSLGFTKEKVIIYVADSIHAINLEVRNNISYEKSKSLAEEMGANIISQVEKHLKIVLSKEDLNKIVYVRWGELVDEQYILKTKYLEQKYTEDRIFQEKIENIVRNFTSKEQRIFSSEDIHRLGDYIIQELPECLCRVQMAGYECDAYTYPYDGEIVEFIEQIQNGTMFPEIKEAIMDTPPKVLLVVR